MNTFLDEEKFVIGETWASNDGAGHTATITQIKRRGTGRWDFDVFYVQKNGQPHDKDGFCFQIRYGRQHMGKCGGAL